MGNTMSTRAAVEHAELAIHASRLKTRDLLDEQLITAASATTVMDSAGDSRPFRSGQ